MKPKHFLFSWSTWQWYSSRAQLVSDNDNVDNDGVVQTWCPCRLGKQKGLHQLNDIGYSYQLTAVKTRNLLTSATWPYGRLRCSLQRLFIRRQSHTRWRPKKIYRSTWVNLCMQLISLQFDMEDPFHGHWQLSEQGVHWPVSHDCIVGSSLELTKVMYFLKLHRWPGYRFSLDRRLKYFLNYNNKPKNRSSVFRRG